jgi:hypothetical protein
VKKKIDNPKQNKENKKRKLKEKTTKGRRKTRGLKLETKNKNTRVHVAIKHEKMKTRESITSSKLETLKDTKRHLVIELVIEYYVRTNRNY